jgi:two-component sensor histidine kinase
VTATLGKGASLFANRSISLKQGLLLIVLAALVPITATSILQGRANWNNMEKAAMAKLHANAKAVAERERDAFVVSARMLMVGAANPDIRDFTAQCNQDLQTGFTGYDPILNFVRTDASGKVRCSILPFRDGHSFADETWWARTKNSSSMTISQPTIGTVSGVPVIIMALPVKDRAGNFAGTFSAGLEISKLSRSISMAPESKTGSIAIISKNDELIAMSGEAIPFGLPADLRDGTTGIAQSASGKEWFYSVASVVGDELHVVYAEPHSRTMSPALEQFRVSIVLPLMAILLTLLAIWFGTNRLVIRWLAALRKLSDEMTKGNFRGNRQAFADAPLELRELSDDLHHMAQVIDTRTTELTDALNAKTELTREVHHRVKNNLQIVTSLLTMQAARMTDEGAKIALQQSRARIAALALIHRLTYERDSSDSEPSVTVEMLMDELCKQLRYAFRERRNVLLSCSTDKLALSVDLAVPFALFIVEAVTNSYRHAFPDDTNGKIDLSLNLDGETAILSVTDNGQGYDVAVSASGDLGTELMQGFASQLNGDLSFASDRGSGSSTSLRFPIPSQI